MQATSMKQFVISRSGAVVVALSILIAGAAGVVALTLGSDLSGNETVESARVMPQAYVSAGQGEGFVDATNAAAVTSRLQAHTGSGQGEGMVDATHPQRQPRQVIAHSRLDVCQGEGLVDATIRGNFEAAGQSIDEYCHDVERSGTGDAGEYLSEAESDVVVLESWFVGGGASLEYSL